MHKRTSETLWLLAVLALNSAAGLAEVIEVGVPQQTEWCTSVTVAIQESSEQAVHDELEAQQAVLLESAIGALASCAMVSGRKSIGAPYVAASPTSEGDTQVVFCSVVQGEASPDCSGITSRTRSERQVLATLCPSGNPAVCIAELEARLQARGLGDGAWAWRFAESAEDHLTADSVRRALSDAGLVLGGDAPTTKAAEWVLVVAEPTGPTLAQPAPQ